MESLGPLVRKLRRNAGLSQRDLALRAATSQPAVARYERGAATPSWETLERLAEACGQRILLSTEALPETHDVELATLLLGLTPQERLRALRSYARLQALASARR
jgi:uncharacterized protein